MTVIGVDDTDSRERGMCTTYLAARIAERIGAAGGQIDERLLIRLNPAVERKTRGNAALAIHTDLDADHAADIARDELEPLAEVEDPRTSPGLVVADCDPEEVPDTVAEFAQDAVREFHGLDDALALATEAGFHTEGWAGGHGRIGALAAVGAHRAFSEWTCELIAYREFERCGTPRDVDEESLFDAADAAYPKAWDTVDRGEGEAVCVPSAPGPILYGIRGDSPDAVREVAAGIDSEPVERTALFRTNQGTDVHLRDTDTDDLADLEDGGAYRVDCVVDGEPETREGGHVFVPIRGADGESTLDAAAFEPTKRFRDRVRTLRAGDELTICGELSDGTLKLEKFAVRELNRTEKRNPVCPDCGNTMGSAGRDQGYRCRDCGTSAPGKVAVEVERDLELGWYEVPPCARRHVAKPLVRGGFDAPTHPER
ncbi:TiaS agmantine-binding domain-containing protein [Halolamina salifodinae]|uniref:tRNA(Ile2) 2-agmatinylcytidine synthetase TiaS n=1 Tax=Halolamina salifodinae TaxID=1202767 RepID=A0A8T4H4H1_9EURY|nr:tRNA(Ile)(2)-agmatinylcytidine synthase [Halolamina salifodinae]MBP1988048.1 tRNA(Ile2)-agmatinylcytidine synthase [Halolamina salifodinae]